MFKMGCSMAKRILAIDGRNSPAGASDQTSSKNHMGGKDKQIRSGNGNNTTRKPTTTEELNDFSKLQDDPRIPLNVRQIFKITKSWKAIARTMNKTGTAMFLNLFEQNQDLFYLFDRFQHLKGKELHESMELKEHAATVMSTLDQSIHSLSDYDNFVTYLHSIGELHRKVPGFKRAHFWKIEQPFMKAIKQTLDDRCSEAIEEIYKIAIKLIIETIADGYGEDALEEATIEDGHSKDDRTPGDDPAGSSSSGATKTSAPFSKTDKGSTAEGQQQQQHRQVLGVAQASLMSKKIAFHQDQSGGTEKKQSNRQQSGSSGAESMREKTSMRDTMFALKSLLALATSAGTSQNGKVIQSQSSADSVSSSFIIDDGKGRQLLSRSRDLQMFGQPGKKGVVNGATKHSKAHGWNSRIGQGKVNKICLKLGPQTCRRDENEDSSKSEQQQLDLQTEWALPIESGVRWRTNGYEGDNLRAGLLIESSKQHSNGTPSRPSALLRCPMSGEGDSRPRQAMTVDPTTHAMNCSPPNRTALGAEQIPLAAVRQQPESLNGHHGLNDRTPALIVSSQSTAAKIKLHEQVIETEQERNDGNREEGSNHNRHHHNNHRQPLHHLAKRKRKDRPNAGDLVIDSGDLVELIKMLMLTVASRRASATVGYDSDKISNSYHNHGDY